jgi:hypothetical protein
VFWISFIQVNLWLRSSLPKHIAPSIKLILQTFLNLIGSLKLKVRVRLPLQDPLQRCCGNTAGRFSNSSLGLLYLPLAFSAGWHIGDNNHHADVEVSMSQEQADQAIQDAEEIQATMALEMEGISG